MGTIEQEITVLETRINQNEKRLAELLNKLLDPDFEYVEQLRQEELTLRQMNAVHRREIAALRVRLGK